MIVKVILCIKDNKRKEFQELIEELQPYDLSLLYIELPKKHRKGFLDLLGIDMQVLLIQELPNEYRKDVLEKLQPKNISYILDKMDNDDLAVLLEDLEDEEAEELLENMNDEESHIVTNMMQYEVETAGRLMTNRFVWVLKDFTVKQAVQKMKELAQYTETINYLYVVNENKQLVGVVSHRDLILADGSEIIQEIMFSRVLSVKANTDQEEIAKVIEKYDFLAIPVIDDDGKLLGIITVDDILDVVIQEANEDIEKLSASGKSIDFQTKASIAAFRRLPWLILLLLIGLLSGKIISQFEHTLEKVVALTFFMPMIAGMTGNTGTQSLAVTVRGLIQQEISKKVIIQVIIRELFVGIIIGLICGSLITLVAYLWQGNVMLGLVVGVSLFFTLIIGTLAGTIIPLFLHHIRIDPAIASGPLITTLNDIFSLLIYFSLATIFIEKII